MRRAQVEAVVDLQRSDLVGGLVRVVRTAQIAGLVVPDRLQALDVLRSDLRQRRIALAMLGTPVGMPVALRHAVVDGRRLGQWRRQHAFDVMTVAPHRIDSRHTPEQHRQHQRKRCTTPGTEAEMLPAQATRDPWCEQPQAERRDDAAAWRQLPPVQADFVQRPAERTEHEQGVHPQRRAAAHQQQDTGQQKAGRQDGEVPGSAEADDLCTADAKRQPDDDAEQSADDYCHGANSSLLLFDLHTFQMTGTDGHHWNGTGDERECSVETAVRRSRPPARRCPGD